MLEEILRQPSAPFREKHVLEVFSKKLTDARVPFFRDPIGNLVLGVGSKKDYLKLISKKSNQPVPIFIAHTDHPGFHGLQWKSKTELEVKWHGGAPTQHVEGARVWLSSSQIETLPNGNYLGHGHLKQVKLIESGRSIDRAVVSIDPSEIAVCESPATELYGGFSFRSPLWKEGEILYTKAADDLVGAATIASIAIEYFQKKTKGLPFLGLLTRAEEVGYIGCIGHFELAWYRKAKRPLVAVSLETSRTLPGAEIGKGPVVRLGDRSGVFSTEWLMGFSAIAEAALPGAHQKRVMDGGTCEATAALTYGIPAIGISVPLGNYHNQSFEGGPDSAGPNSGPAPEFVHVNDIQGMKTLCTAILKSGDQLFPKDPYQKRRRQFSQSFKGYSKLLRSGP